MNLKEITRIYSPDVEWTTPKSTIPRRSRYAHLLNCVKLSCKRYVHPHYKSQQYTRLYCYIGKNVASNCRFEDRCSIFFKDGFIYIIPDHKGNIKIRKYGNTVGTTIEYSAKTNSFLFDKIGFFPISRFNYEYTEEGGIKVLFSYRMKI